MQTALLLRPPNRWLYFSVHPFSQWPPLLVKLRSFWLCRSGRKIIETLFGPELLLHNITCAEIMIPLAIDPFGTYWLWCGLGGKPLEEGIPLYVHVFETVQ